MDRVTVATLLVIICLYGLYHIWRRLNASKDNRNFTKEFLNKLTGYFNSRGGSVEDYDWMTLKSEKMQHILGEGGILYNYRGPYQNDVYPVYQIIPNMLPSLRHALSDNVLSGDVADQYAHTLRDVLLRHIGSTGERIDSLVNDILNPLKWFREGVKEVVSMPVYLLSMLGILGEPLVSNMLSSNLFRVLSGVVALISFLSAVITIGLGWEQFSEKIITLL